MLVPELPGSTTLLLGGAVALSLLWWLSTRRPPGIPPGPGPALPLLGHLHLVDKDPRARFGAWRRQYGDVFSLYMGGRLVVVLNGFPVIKEALVKFGSVFSDRPSVLFIDKMFENRGLVFTSGPRWKEHRKLSLEILREFGLGKNVLAEKIQEEVSHYIKAIEDHQGAPVDLHVLTSTSVSNNICSIVFGKRFHYDDPAFTKYLALLDANVRTIGTTAALIFFPFLSRLPGDWFNAKAVLSNVRVIEDTFIRPQIESHLKTFSKDTITDYIHAYIRQMTKRREDGKDTSLDEFSLLKATSDLFLAGTETTSTAINWTLLYLLHHPEVQDKCYKEICDVIGTGRLPSFGDKANMTYLEATTMEVLRAANIAPLATYHAAPHDITFRGHIIPKDAVILPNLDSVLQDPEIWGDPENFRPERFIDPDGKVKRPEEFIPFGMGRRVCLGESLARMELFLYVSSLVQRFRFLPPEDGTLPSLEGILGATYTPKPYRIRAVLRE